MELIVAAHLAWIVAQTGLNPPEHPPIRFAALDEIAPRSGWTGNVSFQYQGLYNRSARVIYLPQDWKANDLRQKSALLHELVHHVQRANNIVLPCIAAYERLAFELQIKWLRDQGVADPYGVIGINELGINLVSVCRD